MKRIFLFIASLFLFGLGWSADMSQFLGSITVELDSPDVVQTQKRGFVSFGGAHLKSDYAVFQPFQAVPPSVKAGCSGIDITMGGVSYLNADYLVEFLQSAVSVAPAYFFQLALQSICPQCAELFNNLTALANQINALGMNSCQAGMLAANFVFNQVSSSINKGDFNGWVDAANNGFKSFNDLLADWQEDISGYLNAAQVNAIVANGSLLNYVAGTAPIGNEILGFVKATIGDMKFERQGDKCISVTYIDPVISWEEAQRRLSEEGCDAPTITVQTRTGPVQVSSVCYYVKQRIDQIIHKIKTKTALSQQELEMLATYPFPVYKILKIYAPYPEALEGIKDPLVKYASALTLQTIISRYLSQTLDGVSSIVNLVEKGKFPGACETPREVLIKKFENYRDNIVRFMNEAPKDLRAKRQELLRALSVANTVIELERTVYSKFSDNPIVASYIYAKSLGMR